MTEPSNKTTSLLRAYELRVGLMILAFISMLFETINSGLLLFIFLILPAIIPSLYARKLSFEKGYLFHIGSGLMVLPFLPFPFFTNPHGSVIFSMMIATLIYSIMFLISLYWIIKAKWGA